MSAESKSVCVTCRLPRATNACGVCQASVCKKCVQKLDKEPFPFLGQVADELKHRLYCVGCYSEKVEPVKSAYDHDLAQARQVFIFKKSKGTETRLMNRSEKPIKVADCQDHADALMKLAFHAVRAGYNALIDVDVACKKIRNHGYQTSLFHGIGVPTMVDAERLNREDPPRY